MNEILVLLSEFNVLSITFRLLLAVLIGAVIGVDRYRRGSPAGIKTHALVCVGSALVMLTSEFSSIKFGTSDIARLPAQVISGVGFLGAGTIMVTGKNQIKGLTTAAGLWLSACIGLAVGIGFYFASILSVVLTLVVMKIVSKLDMRTLQANHIELYLEFLPSVSLGSLIRIIKKHGCMIDMLDQSFASIQQDNHKVNFIIISMNNEQRSQMEKCIAALCQVDGVITAEEL